MPSGGGTTRTVSSQELAPEQRELLGMIMPAARDHATTPLEMFPGSTIANTTSLQDYARSNLVNTAAGPVSTLSNNTLNTAAALQGGATPAIGGAGTLLGAGSAGSAGLGELLSGYSASQGGRDFLRSGALLNPATNPVLGAQTSAAIQPLTKQLTESVLPGIKSNFVGNNMFGSSRQGIAEGSAIDSWLRQAGDVSTNLQANNFNQGLGAMLSSLNSGESAASAGVGQGLGAGSSGVNSLFNSAIQSLTASPSLAQLAFLPGMTMEGVGAMDQSMDQARLTEQANRFSTEQMLPFLQAMDVANLAFGIGGGSATTSAQQNAAFNPLSTGLGMMMLLPMLGGMF